MLAFVDLFSPWHLLLIGIVAILLFGNRLPEVARSLGRSVNEFKRGLKEVKDNLDADVADDPPKERLQPPPDKEDTGQVDKEPAAQKPSESHESRTP